MRSPCGEWFQSQREEMGVCMPAQHLVSELRGQKGTPRTGFFNLFPTTKEPHFPLVGGRGGSWNGELGKAAGVRVCTHGGVYR